MASATRLVTPSTTTASVLTLQAKVTPILASTLAVRSALTSPATVITMAPLQGSGTPCLGSNVPIVAPPSIGTSTALTKFVNYIKVTMHHHVGLQRRLRSTEKMRNDTMKVCRAYTEEIKSLTDELKVAKDLAIDDKKKADLEKADLKTELSA
ncbi:hypothetical protein NE237_001181 [Protea cynaroides]|uniref:Uncharacterized protein n=1 Tax=Protea cynaroides TaxID=273540 RepID=A0A9Q0QXU4_9MAGN|nr:hypothetical protein NE237_001181 [Protea cynaroides]